MNSPRVIAVDGPAASGKGTLSRKLAEKLNFAHLDTGAIYRAVSLYLVQQNLDGDAANAVTAAEFIRDNLTLAMLQNPELRTDEIGSMTSRISAIPEVRAILLETQRAFALAPPAPFDGAVLDGRDIGTVVCPDAAVKLYVTADTETRAKRRFMELKSRNIPTSFDEVLADMKIRDERDMNRDTAPLKPAVGAVIIDTSALTPAEALDQALTVARAVL